MNIIVDTSILIAVIVNEQEKTEIVRLTEGSDIFSPESVHWEIGNAFSAMLKRNRISLDNARKALELYNKIAIRFVKIDLVSSLILASKLGMYAYDAYVLQCAVQYSASVISLDRKLIKQARKLHLNVLEV